MQLSATRAAYVGWLVETRPLSPHTLRAYASDLLQFERCVGASADARALTRQDVLHFVAAQREARLSETSIRRRLAALHGFIGWLRSNGHLDPDVDLVAGVELRPTRRLPRAVPESDLRALLAHLRRAVVQAPGHHVEPARHPRDLTTMLLVGLMLATGIRVGELVGMRVSDVDLRRRSIRILGKGSRERTVFFASDWLDTTLTVHINASADGRSAPSYVFAHGDGRPLTTDSVRRRLTKVARAAGVTTRVTPHALRHSAATQLLESGVDIRYVQQQLGHSSITMTERYTHVTNLALARAVSEASVLDHLLAGLSTPGQS